MSALSGIWFNQHGSRLQLDVHPDGRVSGGFHTRADGAPVSRDFSLVGFASGDLLSFTVNFGEIGSLTAWVGHHGVDELGDTLHTMWQMSVRVPHPDRPEDTWKSTWTGADEFRRHPPAEIPRWRRTPSHPLWLAD